MPKCICDGCDINLRRWVLIINIIYYILSFKAFVVTIGKFALILIFGFFKSYITNIAFNYQIAIHIF